MAAAFGALASKAYAAQVNTTCSKPTTAVGDTMVAYLVHGGASIPTITAIPSGWTEYTTTTFATASGAGFNLKLRVWFRATDGSEGANFTWSHASASTVMAIVNYSGANTTAPIGPVSQNNGMATGGNTSTYLTVTPTAGACLTTVGFDWADTTNNLVPPSGTPTLTERYDSVVLYVATADNVPATATGSRTQTNNCTNGGANSAWFATQLSIDAGAAAAASAAKKLLIQRQALVRASYW
jgi:hypothetical protein